mmetsp:Transcript_41762/g.75821  ORF Transcript_41762/g.75821 Transcript_41762/m.75821 type:complete len:467 (+) Transcript_41762:49-1449(+)
MVVEETCVTSDDGAPFTEVISLGERCPVASWLRHRQLRRAAHPFDWIYSSPRILRHCLDDNFATLLDQSQFFKAAGGKIGHKTYSKMLQSKAKEIVWLHQNPTMPTHYAKLCRSVERLRAALREPNKRRLFLIFQLVQSKLALNGVSETSEADGSGNPLAVSSATEVRCLFDKLVEQNVVNFQLAVVRLCTKSACEGKAAHEAEAVLHHTDEKAHAKLSIHNLYLKSNHTGLKFKDAKDEQALLKLVFGSEANMKRRTKLPGRSRNVLHMLRGKSRAFPKGGYLWSQECFSDSLPSHAATPKCPAPAAPTEVVLVEDSLESGHPTPPRGAGKEAVPERSEATEALRDATLETANALNDAECGEALGGKGSKRSKSVDEAAGLQGQSLQTVKRVKSCHADVGRHVAVVDPTARPGYVGVISDVDVTLNTFKVIVVSQDDGACQWEERCVQREHCIYVGNPLVNSLHR